MFAIHNRITILFTIDDYLQNYLLIPGNKIRTRYFIPFTAKSVPLPIKTIIIVIVIVIIIIIIIIIIITIIIIIVIVINHTENRNNKYGHIFFLQKTK